MLLFVVGAVFGEGQVVQRVVVGAVFGEGQVLLFVAGAALGECLNVRLGPKRCIYNRKCSWGPRKVTSLARRFAVCVFMVGSFSDHARIMLGSSPHWK